MSRNCVITGCILVFFFFFQAEDGIRDLVRSRGLGDVYKRQGGAYAQAAAMALLNHTELSAADIVKRSLEIAGELCIYTNMQHTIETL